MYLTIQTPCVFGYFIFYISLWLNLETQIEKQNLSVLQRKTREIRMRRAHRHTHTNKSFVFNLYERNTMLNLAF